MQGTNISWYHPCSCFSYNILLKNSSNRRNVSQRLLLQHVHIYMLQKSSSGGKFNTISELRRLSAGDLLSLAENIALLCTFSAFVNYIFITVFYHMQFCCKCQVFLFIFSGWSSCLSVLTSIACVTLYQPMQNIFLRRKTKLHTCCRLHNALKCHIMYSFLISQLFEKSFDKLL